MVIACWKTQETAFQRDHIPGNEAFRILGTEERKKKGSSGCRVSHFLLKSQNYWIVQLGMDLLVLCSNPVHGGRWTSSGCSQLCPRKFWMFKDGDAPMQRDPHPTLDTLEKSLVCSIIPLSHCRSEGPQGALTDINSPEQPHPGPSAHCPCQQLFGVMFLKMGSPS